MRCTPISIANSGEGNSHKNQSPHATDTMPALPSLSAAGWTQSIIAVVAILSQLSSLYDPSSFMTTYDISSIPAARLNGSRTLALADPSLSKSTAF
jgi:hypothetical protein